jgi:DNA mismatch endonuclease (patch repair protein)
MSLEKRSKLMGRIRGRGTKCELAVATLLRAAGLDFDEQARDLPGRPDFVLRDAKVAVFVDGDFWHGWRFPKWRLKLSEHWEAKIAGNMRRDQRNFRRLRRSGWTVLRLWEHQVTDRPDRCIERIVAAVKSGIIGF